MINFTINDELFYPDWTHSLYQEFFLEISPILHEFVKENDILLTSTMFDLIGYSMNAIKIFKITSESYLFDSLQFLNNNADTCPNQYLKVKK